MSSSCHLNHGLAIWFTGMPGSGKTTVAIALHALLDEKNVPTVMLDGDLIRPIICEGLGHTAEDRWKSLEKYTQLTTQLISSRVISILAVINHAEKQRAFAREAHPQGRFFGVWINTPVEVCQSRDPKGLYARANASEEPPSMVGVDIEYEQPRDADVVIDTLSTSPEEAAVIIFDQLVKNGIIEVN